MLRWVFIAWLVIQFLVSYDNGMYWAVQWVALNAVVLLLLYGVFLLIRRLVRRPAPRHENRHVA